MMRISCFNDSANKLFATAVLFAESLNCNYLGTEHFLYAFIGMDTKRAKKARDMGITPEAVAEEIKFKLANDSSLRIKGGRVFDYINKDMFNDDLENVLDRLFEQFSIDGSILGVDDVIDSMNCSDCEFSRLVNTIARPSSKITKKLLEYGYDLTALAAKGKLDPVVGRDKEIQDVIDVMLRKNKKNPCLIGEAGVGKTAIIEGIAQRIVEGTVPEKLKGKVILALDVTSLISGTKYRGDFEQRMKDFIKEVQKNQNIILFVDEIHTLVDAGSSSEGGMSAVNMLKPMLARDSFQIIGATTTNEYRITIEKDAALVRRLQSVMINEPSIPDTITMMESLQNTYETYHNVSIEKDAILASVNLSSRYITDRFLPDKAITILDETSARVSAFGKTSVEKIDIVKTIEKTTGIKIDEVDIKADVEKILNSNVLGQKEAVSLVAKTLKRGKVGLHNPNKPVGSFLFVGPTGVGKTELAKNIAKHFGSGKNLIKLDMSEFMEKHSVSKIIGSPPGYVGYNDGGQLTEKVRRNPYAVVLFDEIEKAHPEVCDILLQILDEGELTDNMGNKINFKNTIVVITSNVGSNLLAEKKTNIGFGNVEDKNNKNNNKDIVMNAIKARFRPEFINRIDNIVVFNSLDVDACKTICKNMLEDIHKIIVEKNIFISFDNSIVNMVVKDGFDATMGARNIKRTIQSLVEDVIADAIINEEICPDVEYVMSCKKGCISFIKSKQIVLA